MALSSGRIMEYHLHFVQPLSLHLYSFFPLILLCWLLTINVHVHSPDILVTSVEYAIQARSSLQVPMIVGWVAVTWKEMSDTFNMKSSKTRTQNFWSWFQCRIHSATFSQGLCVLLSKQARSQTFVCVCVCGGGGGGGSNWSTFGTFYDYAWIILRSRWIWPFFFGGGGRQMTPPDPPGYGPEPPAR